MILLLFLTAQTTGGMTSMWVLVKFKWSIYQHHLEFYYIYIYMNMCKTCAISLKITCKAFLLCHTMIMSQNYTSWENNLIFFNVKTIVELVFLHHAAYVTRALSHFRYFYLLYKNCVCNFFNIFFLFKKFKFK